MPTVIAFTGRAGAGKTSAARCLKDALHAPGPGGRTTVLAFAEPLRYAVNAVFPHLGRETFSESKNEPISGMPGWSGRRILQVAGTDWFRSIDTNVWVKNMEHRLRVYSRSNDFVFIDDVRFENEAKLIESIGGALYRIVRPGHTPLVGAQATHSSEASIDGLPVKGEILNVGSLEDFENKIIALLGARR